MLVIIDYGASNLRSVTRAVEYAGAQPIVSADPAYVRRATALILPGVGAADETARALRERGLAEPFREAVADGRPVLGVCVGLQVLFETTEEGGGAACLGLLPGRVRRLPAGQKVPHMGWNQVWSAAGRRHPVLEGIPDGTNFYFVHSYYVAPADPAIVLGETEYGVRFPSLIATDNLIATQFHPEKSGAWGLRFYHNFCRLALGAAIG